ncbi:hypothetical protein EV2_015563 [Malus domestica]
MLKVPDHQVAGHQAGGGKLGPLVDDSGHFYKPLQSDERGSHEVAFYTAFSTDTRIPDHFRKFFPVFHGTKLLEASDGSGLYPHLALEDIVSGRTHPCILDAKIGARTWYPQAAEDYLQKCLKKDRETACLELGFRISGLQVYGNKLTGLWKPDRHVIQSGSVDNSKLALRKFVSSNPSTDSDIKPDCSFTSTVYGGPDGILAQLLVLKSWFEEQTFYHFYSCSVLMVYDRESILQGKNRGAQIKLVDFAHVIDGRDSDNLQDTCPTSPPGKQTIFINGFPCKNPNSIAAPDFKTSKLTEPGNTDNFFGSSVTLVTAADFPGLNTLGLSIARTDLRIDGMVSLHSHPRASELFFVSKGIVLAGFIDTKNQPFQQVLAEGDVFVFPKGLLHFSLNFGYDFATVFSVFNSQNPGVVEISGAIFQSDLDMIDSMTKGFLTHNIGNLTLNKQQFRKLNPII